MHKSSSTWIEASLQYNYYRSVGVPNGTSLTIEDCIYYPTLGDKTTAVSNSYLIPRKVKGFK